MGSQHLRLKSQKSKSPTIEMSAHPSLLTFIAARSEPSLEVHQYMNGEENVVHIDNTILLGHKEK